MAEEPAGGVANPPGQGRLRRRLYTHAQALAALRAAMSDHASGTQADGTRSPATLESQRLRGLAHATTDDPVAALLDAWAVTVDTVCFYNERIATEGFLRTATEHRSLRELARSLGYELSPGVAAEIDLVFSVETTPGAHDPAQVPAGTPAQSVPGAHELPQTFETKDDLEARAAWNCIPGPPTMPQLIEYGTTDIWVRAGAARLRVGDHLLVVGDERHDAPTSGSHDDLERWDFRVIKVIDESTPGWVRVTLDRAVGFHAERPLTAGARVTVHLLPRQEHLFGYNAPDSRLVVTDRALPETMLRRRAPHAVADGSEWDGFSLSDADTSREVELAGDHPDVVVDSWVVLIQPGAVEAYRVTSVTPSGAAKFGLTGSLTRLVLDTGTRLSSFDRRSASVFCASVPLETATQPASEKTPAGTTTVRLARTTPLLPRGRRLLLADRHGTVPVVDVTVADCTVDGGEASDQMLVTLTAPLGQQLPLAGLQAWGNVVTATHGESVIGSVLGSGDGKAAFQTFRPRRTPLTFVRRGALGARPELSVRVDRVLWTQVEDIGTAGPHDRVYQLKLDEDGASRIVLGDGVHGSRAPTGAENVVADYRVGIGASGSVKAGQVVLLPRRPVGVREVLNPTPSREWAPEETLDEARTNAPQRVRTLDRAVSVADHEDVARAFPGVGVARADLVWDGRRERIVLSILGTGAQAPSRSLKDDLRGHLVTMRDPGSPFLVLPGEQTWFAVRLELAHDPAYQRADVEAAVRAALAAAFGAEHRPFATAVSRAAVLLVVHDVPGVRSCTMPRILRLDDDPPPPPATAPVPLDSPPFDEVLVARPAHSTMPVDPRDPPVLLAAELLALAPDAVEIGVMQR